MPGLMWSEVKQLWDVGLEDYLADMWNVIDFITNSLYVATVALRIVSYYQASDAIDGRNAPMLLYIPQKTENQNLS